MLVIVLVQKYILKLESSCPERGAVIINVTFFVPKNEPCSYKHLEETTVIEVDKCFG